MTALLNHGLGDEIDFDDWFCGLGGGTSGLVRAGMTGKLAANHWDRAIESHSANHPDIEHLLGDIQAIDLRYLPKTAVLWASPICTELSPAGGRKRRDAQGGFFEQHGHVPTAAFERTRATFWEVIRSAEVRQHKVILVENVIEAASWVLFDTWLRGMETLGYECQIVCVSAAHIGGVDNPYAPQWRDRMYLVFSKKGIPLPDVQPRPWAWCETCEENVQAVQWWKKPGQRIGKYGAQYLYVCPTGHPGPIEPYVAPAINAIDWSDLGVRIGDREALGMRKLGAATMRRIEYGVRMIGDPALIAAGGNAWDRASAATATGAGKTKVPESYLRAWPAMGSPTPAQVTAIQNGIAMSEKFVFAVNHGADHEGRHFDPDTRPLPSRTTKSGEGLVTTEPFVTMLRAHGRATGMGEPLRTFSTGRNHGLTIPPGSFIMKQYGGQLADAQAVKSTEEPMPPAVSSSTPWLVIPYRKGAKPYCADDAPVSTVATREQHGVLAGGGDPVNVDDCYFRMLSPREAANAQRFERDYIMLGNKGEQQMLAGNAVAVNVSQWLGEAVVEALS